MFDWLFNLTLLNWLYIFLIVIYIGILIYDYYYYKHNSIVTYILGSNSKINVRYENGQEKIFKSLGSISDPENVRRIDCKNSYLTCLDGIEIFKNLEELDCSSNFLVNLVSSANTHILPATLKRLNVSFNYVMDLSGIQSCKNLEALDCSHNMLLSLTPLKACPLLTSLDCGVNKIISLNGIQNCVHLRELFFDTNLITHIPNFVADFNSLTDINMENNPIEVFPSMNIDQVENFVTLIRGKQSSKFRVYNDKQNTHNSHINKSIKISVQNIMAEPIVQNVLIRV